MLCHNDIGFTRKWNHYVQKSNYGNELDHIRLSNRLVTFKFGLNALFSSLFIQSFLFLFGPIDGHSCVRSQLLFHACLKRTNVTLFLIKIDTQELTTLALVWILLSLPDLWRTDGSLEHLLRAQEWHLASPAECVGKAAQSLCVIHVNVVVGLHPEPHTIIVQWLSLDIVIH